MPMPTVKPINRAAELERLRQELLRRIVRNEARRQTQQHAAK
jgi:hypothetical protein